MAARTERRHQEWILEPLNSGVGGQLPPTLHLNGGFHADQAPAPDRASLATPPVLAEPALDCLSLGDYPKQRWRISLSIFIRMEEIMEFVPMIGVGVSDLQHAALAEVQRITKETKGDALAQMKLLLGMLRERNLINDKEVTALSQVATAGHEAGTGKKSAQAAYFEVRKLHNTLLASPVTSPVALTLASSAVGSYSITQGSGGETVVFKKSGGGWEGRGAAAGAIIGSVWGPLGAAVGGAVGGLVGAAVDECKA